MSEYISQFLKNPEQLRKLDDFEFDQIYEYVTIQYKTLFIKGQAWIPHDPKSDEFRVKISEGPDKGKQIVVPHLPLKLFRFLSVVTEEKLIRTFTDVANSLLADMMLDFDAYSDLWQSFGEHQVYERQLELSINREKLIKYGTQALNDKISNTKVNSKEVNKFRENFASKIADGKIKPKSSEQFLDEGFDFFGVRYNITDNVEIAAIPSRFRSKLSFVTNSSPTYACPFQFSLGFAERMKLDVDFSILDPQYGKKFNELYQKGQFGVKSMNYDLVISPTLAPDMLGWTPHFK